MSVGIAVALAAGCGGISFRTGADGDAGVGDAAAEAAASPAPEGGPLAASDAAPGPSGAGDAGARPTLGLVALWTFDEGGGTVARDTSGVAPALDLTVPVGASWKPGALVVGTPILVASGASAQKIVAACAKTSEVSVEAWIVPSLANGQSLGRILGVSLDTSTLDVTLSQNQGQFLFRIRTSASGEANNDLSGGAAVQRLQHVVLTRRASGARVIWLDGARAATGAGPAGDFSTWTSTYKIAVANEHTSTRPWLGEIHRIAIYDRALGDVEVAASFAAGP
jgi:hypothetical protein